MDRIPRTDDPTINSLIARIERHHGTKVVQSSLNHYAITPYIWHIAVNHIEYASSLVEVRSGSIIDDTLINPRSRDRVLYCELRVGNDAAQGRGFAFDKAPLKDKTRRQAASLEMQVDHALSTAFCSARENYNERIFRHSEDAATIVPNLIEVPLVGDGLEKLRKVQIPVDRLRKLAETCSAILSSDGDPDQVGIYVHDETRRFVNSEGSVIRDNFFGYHLAFNVTAMVDGKNSPWEFGQGLFFTDKVDEEQVLRFVRRMHSEIKKRKKECKRLTEGEYPVLNSSAAMTTDLHEFWVHHLASDEILYGKSTTLGWENFGKPLAPPGLNAYVDPGMPDKWGSMRFDHEGVPAQRRQLVKDGRVVGYLADRDGAYHLSRLTGSKILPGDARIGYPGVCQGPKSLPRISNLTFEYTESAGKNKARTKTEMLRRFVQYLQETGREEGVYIADMSEGESFTERGGVAIQPDFAYIVDRSGKMYPTNFVSTTGEVHASLRNIVTMGGPVEYVPHMCGIDDEMVRGGISCPMGIISNVKIQVGRPKQLRQPRLK